MALKPFEDWSDSDFNLVFGEAPVPTVWPLYAIAVAAFAVLLAWRMYG